MADVNFDITMTVLRFIQYSQKQGAFNLAFEVKLSWLVKNFFFQFLKTSAKHSIFCIMLNLNKNVLPFI